MNDLDDNEFDDTNIDEVESFLAHKTMIIGGAAFQGIWEEQSAPTLGFNPAPTVSEQPELHQLVKYLPRELLNRFSSEIFILPSLKKGDYESMIETIAGSISETWRKRFVEFGMARLDQAVRHQKGARYAEEILLAAIVAERSCMANWAPEAESPKMTPDNLDDPEETIGIF